MKSERPGDRSQFGTSLPTKRMFSHAFQNSCDLTTALSNNYLVPCQVKSNDIYTKDKEGDLTNMLVSRISKLKERRCKQKPIIVIENVNTEEC